MKTRILGIVCALFCLLMIFPALADELHVLGCAYVDANENGLCDAGETLMSGVPIRLERLAGDAVEVVSEQVTDAYGAYTCDASGEGVYRLVCALSNEGYYAATLGDSQRYSCGALCLDGLASGEVRADIGLRPATRVTVDVYQDGNGNGKLDKNERFLAGATLEILDASGSETQAVVLTDGTGSVAFFVAPGEHVLRATLPDGYAFSVLGENSRMTGEDASAVSEPFVLTRENETALGVAARAAGYFKGRTFEDMNNNGVMDEDEPGVAGVTIRLSGKRTGVERSLVTDETGEYLFDRLPGDLYTITAELPEGMLYARYSTAGGDLRSIFTGSVTSREFSVKSSSPVSDKHIGLVQKGVISGVAFFDLNYNGLMDEGEPGYAGVTVEAIKLSSGESLGKCVTGEKGDFRLENLRGGDYRLRAILPADGSVFSVTAEGTPDTANRFVQRATRRENSLEPLTIASGGEVSVLIGVARGATVQGSVFEDSDYNGRKGGKEKAISGAQVRAVNANGEIAATTTANAKGEYKLEGLMPGSYTIQVRRKARYGFTRLRPQQKDGSHIVALEDDWGVTAPMDIAMGEALKGINAGMLPAASVTGSLFHDLNDNGLWDAGEPGMTDARVRLFSKDAEADLLCAPDENGAFTFNGVMPGKYTLSYLLPEHCEMAKTVEGGNTVPHKGAETQTAAFTIAVGDQAVMPLAGAVALGSFEGVVFDDSNVNGLRDGAEKPLAGATVTFQSDAGEKAQAEADAEGRFAVAGLRPGTYKLTLCLPDGYIFSHDVETLALDMRKRQTLDCPWELLVNRSEKAIGAVRPATIQGEIWMDENQDGLQGDAEWIMEGLTLLLVSEKDGMEMASVRSDASGFRFENVRPGAYRVCFELPEQASPAADASSAFRLKGAVMETREVLTLSEDETVAEISTGLVSRTSIAGVARLNVRGSTTPVAGVSVSLFKGDQLVATCETNEEGAYRFDGLWPAEYSVKAAIPQGMIFARADDPAYASYQTIIDDANAGTSAPFALLMAQHRLHEDILYIRPAKVGDIAWLDENGNGLVDGGEPRLSGVRLALVQDGKPVYETVTDSSGYYLFNNVYPGQYTLQSRAWSEVLPTQSVASMRIISSCLVQGDGELAQSEAFRITSGETNLNYDVGYCLREGCALPEEASAPMEERDWTLPNQQKSVIY